MSLREYNKKRDFKKTAEPAGVTRKKTKRPAGQKKLSFVIQKHDASHLHYDFRLELDGVLKSWAVPKGPSLDPLQKRLAMQVEDHPLSYGGFEGTIPEKEYGGGTVMLWDRGDWIPNDKNPQAALRSGSLKFELKGEKLRGQWKLVRMKTNGAKPAWLLMKAKDEYAKALGKGDILHEQSLSVKSGRDLTEIGNAKKSSKLVNTRKTKLGTSLIQSLKNLNITHPDKILYPKAKIRKIDLIEYYLKVAEPMLEHISDRPLMIVRCPGGENAKCFYQKHWVKGFPDSVKKIKVKGEAEPFISVSSAEGLVALAQFGTLEIHCWNTNFAHIERPNQWVFDLDPDDAVSWSFVVDTAYLIKERLEIFGLESFVKTTGGKGLHVVAPVEPKLEWKLAEEFSKAISESVAMENPAKYVTTMSKAKRKGKIFIDYLRNGRGATAVAPYSPRARPTAAVSMPITWQALERGIKSDSFTIENISEALKNYKNAWKDFYKIKQFPKRPKE